MTRTFSRFALAILRAGALICMVPLLSGLGFAQKVVTARATIPFNFWAEGREFQAGDYVFDNEVAGFAAMHRERTNSGISIILYAVPEEGRFVQPQRKELNEPDTLKNPIAAGTRLYQEVIRNNEESQFPTPRTWWPGP